MIYVRGLKMQIVCRQHDRDVLCLITGLIFADLDNTNSRWFLLSEIEGKCICIQSMEPMGVIRDGGIPETTIYALYKVN